MMLRIAAQIDEMSGTWQIIEQALARKKPPRKPQWLADKLGVSAQVMTNWKKRGVPAGRFRSIAEALDLSVDQVERVSLPCRGKARPAGPSQTSAASGSPGSMRLSAR